MKLNTIVQRSTSFGTMCSRKDVISFILKIMIYIIPAILLGDFIDKFVKKQTKNKKLGKNIINYILLQTIMNILVFYSFILFFPEYLNEFQSTMPGLYFITMYFGMQTNYMSMIKQYMNVFI